MLQDRLVAHRGFQKCYPENTLLAHRKAIEAGAHFIETDILFSADCQPVLYHDLTLQRVSGAEGFLHSLTLSELIALPAYEPKRLGQQFIDNSITPLKTLVALLADHPHVSAFIELKQAGVAMLGMEKAYEVVMSCLEPVIDQCVLISFDDAFVQYASHQQYPRLGLVLKEWSQLDSGYISEIKPPFIFIDTDKIPQGASLDDIESTTVIYEIEDPVHAIQWFERGADMIETFDIGGMIDNLAHRAL
ncbi:MAG: glycerophosphodiester phosphodiesterase family protein [Porticoccaceae bacterium]|nr:hypothetical protein [Pseudomonadales bacterium]MCP5171495.1 hypothetical protein [Pseudomonadales bacterium]